MRILKIFLIIVVIVCCTFVVGWQRMERNHHLSFVPPEMQVSNVLYVEENAWGFGPGGNETGFIMYELPADIAKKIDDEGIGYLSSFPSARLGKPHGWQGKYREWRSTPMPHEDKYWFEIPPDGGRTPVPQLSNYMNRYGFGIPVRSDLEEIFDQIIAVPGSYYAYGRIGMIVVSPPVQRVFYVYVG